MFNLKLLIILIITIFLSSNALAVSLPSNSRENTKVFQMGLNEAVELALKNAHSLEAQGLLAKAQGETAKSQKARLFPSLDVEASFTYLTNVGKIDFAPGQTIQLGSNYNYSVGPAVSWVVWDSGRIRKTYKSLKALEKAEIKNYDAAKRQKILEARFAYYKVQLASEQLMLVADSLRLAKSQYEDIAKKFKVGTASKMDLLSAHQEVIDFKRTFKMSQNDLANQLRELFMLIGRSQNEEVSFPTGALIKDIEYLTDEKPNLLIKLDSLGDTITYFSSKSVSPVNIPAHPLVESAHYRSLAAEYATESSKAGHWPTLSFFGKSSLDYPNTPLLENYNQNKLGFMLTVPLFEWGRVSSEVASQRLKSQAALEQKTEIELNLEKEWKQIVDRIDNLKDQRVLNDNAVKETGELADLLYKSYLAGRSGHLEVQRGNLRALQANVESARTDTELLIEMARLSSLASGEI